MSNWLRPKLNGASLEMEVDGPNVFDAHGRDLANDSVTGKTGNGPQLGLLVAKPIIINGPGFNNEGALHSISGINDYTGGVTLGDKAANVGIGVDADPHPSNTNQYFTNDYSLTVGSMAIQTVTVPATGRANRGRGSARRHRRRRARFLGRRRHS